MALSAKKRLEIKRRREFGSLLKEWYGHTSGLIEQTGHDAKISSIAELTDWFVKENLTGELKYQLILAADWEKIVTRQISLLAGFSSLRNGVLYLEIRHSAFMQEEILKASDLLLKRVNEQLGADICKSIRFVPSGRRR